jgi:hypothetical protein
VALRMPDGAGWGVAVAFVVVLWLAGREDDEVL